MSTFKKNVFAFNYPHQKREASVEISEKKNHSSGKGPNEYIN